MALDAGLWTLAAAALLVLVAYWLGLAALALAFDYLDLGQPPGEGEGEE